MAGGAGAYFSLSRLDQGTWQPFLHPAPCQQLRHCEQTAPLLPPRIRSLPPAAVADFIYPQLTFMAAAPVAVCVSMVMLWFQIG